MKGKSTVVLAILLCVFVVFSGCTMRRSSSSSTTNQASPTPENSGRVDMALSVRSDSVEPDDKVKLNVELTNNMLTTIKEVKAKIMTSPVNMIVENTWKNIALTLKNGDSQDTDFKLTVKPKDQFVPETKNENIKVRVKYQTDIRTSAKFFIADTEDVSEREKVVTTSDIVPITIEIDPKTIELAAGNDVQIDVTIKKESTEESTGVEENEIKKIKIIVPGVTDFDLDASTCEYDSDTSKQCKIVNDELELTNVAFGSNDEIQIRIVLPLKEATLSSIKGMEKSVIVTLEDLYLFKDSEIEVVYNTE